MFQVINLLIDAVQSSTSVLGGITTGGGGLVLPDHNHTILPNDGGVLTNDEHDGYSDYLEITDPGTPDANHKRLWLDDIAGEQFFQARGDDGRDLALARDNVIVVRNVTGGPLTRGQVVYFSGGSTGNFPHIALAKANSPNTMPAIGFLFETINNNGFGRVMIWGKLNNINTSAFADGDKLYVSDTTAGSVTNIAPTALGSQVQRIGVVAVSGVGNGAIVVTQTTITKPSVLETNQGPINIDNSPDDYIEPILPPRFSLFPNLFEEIGSWTPAVGGTGGETGQAYTSQVGRFIRYGRLVCFTGRLQLSTLGTITGNVLIKGLPYTSQNVTLENWIYPLNWNNMSTAYVYMQSLLGPNTTNMIITGITAAAVGSPSLLVQADLSATTVLVTSGCYIKE